MGNCIKKPKLANQNSQVTMKNNKMP